MAECRTAMSPHHQQSVARHRTSAGCLRRQAGVPQRRLVAFAAACSHVPDIGGMVRSVEPREVFEEGCTFR
jgi:hypothetical protein